jgi:hypothetical protein
MESTDWEARANREAAAIVMGMAHSVNADARDLMMRCAATAWLQGTIYADHVSLSERELAFRRLQEDLR